VGRAGELLRSASGVMKLLPPLPGEDALYAWVNSVVEATTKDPATKQALVESFVAADKELIAPLFQWRYNGGSAGNGWNSPVNNAQWGTDYLNRTATARSNIYENTPDGALALPAHAAETEKEKQQQVGPGHDPRNPSATL
jgi:hypothetical protein